MARHHVAGRTTRNAAWLALVAACASSTAFAATSSNIICDKASDPMHDDTIEEISATTASHESNLTPRVEALIREAFEETKADDLVDGEAPENATQSGAEESEITVALPGVTSEQVQLYKQQMYRTDI